MRIIIPPLVPVFLFAPAKQLITFDKNVNTINMNYGWLLGCDMGVWGRGAVREGKARQAGKT